METFWTDTKLTQITFWQWFGRVVPMILIVAFLSFYIYGGVNLIGNTIAFILTALSFIPIIWWWWAMDVMKWLSKLYGETIEHQTLILEEIKDIKKELYKPE
jgi:hypothetical protein